MTMLQINFLTDFARLPELAVQRVSHFLTLVLPFTLKEALAQYWVEF